jgi:hypothetical protein
MTDASQNRRYSQAELAELYQEHKFHEKLPACTRHTICDEEYLPTSIPARSFTKRKGYRYLDAISRDEVAVTFHYTLADGSQLRIINRLVIDGKPHDGLLP